MTPSPGARRLALELRAAQAESAPPLFSLPDPLSAEEQRALDDLREENDAFWQARAADPALWRWQRRPAAPVSPPASPRWVWALSACATALALAWFVPAPRSPVALTPSADGAEGVETGGLRTKGAATSPALRLSRVRAGALLPWGQDASARAGDVVQLQVIGLGPDEQAVVLSTDGAGAVTLHYPQRPEERLAAGGAVPRAFELDDAPGFERFFLVTGRQLDVRAVLHSAAQVVNSSDPRAAPLPLPGELHQASVLVRKERGPTGE